MKNSEFTYLRPEPVQSFFTFWLEGVMSKFILVLLTSLFLGLGAASTFALSDLNNEPICRDARVDARCF